METLLDTIRRITAENAARCEEPAWPMLRDLRDARPDMTTERIIVETEELAAAGFIRIGRAIGDEYFELIEEPSEEDMPC